MPRHDTRTLTMARKARAISGKNVRCWLFERLSPGFAAGIGPGAAAGAGPFPRRGGRDRRSRCDRGFSELELVLGAAGRTGAFLFCFAGGAVGLAAGTDGFAGATTGALAGAGGVGDAVPERPQIQPGSEGRFWVRAARLGLGRALER